MVEPGHPARVPLLFSNTRILAYEYFKNRTFASAHFIWSTLDSDLFLKLGNWSSPADSFVPLHKRSFDGTRTLPIPLPMLSESSPAVSSPSPYQLPAPQPRCKYHPRNGVPDLLPGFTTNRPGKSTDLFRRHRMLTASLRPIR